MRETSNLPSAGFWIRAAAFTLDCLIVGVLCLFVRIPFGFLGSFSGANPTLFFRFTLSDVLCYLLSVAYFVLQTVRSGSTLGKKAMGIRVVCATDGGKPGFFSILYRETVGRYLSKIACIGYLYASGEKNKRGFHDLLSDTCVVYSCAPPPADPAPSVPESVAVQSDPLPPTGD